ncbi:NAD(P)/FAD-dependent oxidoreductase [Dechloromonas denitrificans]|uniref:NAD(P)/FAD-dependent oxidoreductase n=1 Tax=Dechloromonas denitrificans TaxID=281362 RepID=UPI001CF83A76|nr:NAD(P)/FAD-dependent oxidoreductase [Dechloromonas denitrificans]UCV05654.1 FAD-dependent oxidoreductase [Dechloromonas denitrificans]UCV05973.1 FAD-dependent oxidoreductase [Dechloromonas denitrificans]
MSQINNDRRRLLQAFGASATLAGAALLPGGAFAAPQKNRKLGRVVVIGGGFGGATAAKYLRKWSNGAIEVVLIERNKEFISCPTSNEVLAGNRDYASLVHSYDALKKNWGIKVVHAEVSAIDPEKRQVRTSHGEQFGYDRLVISPGIEFNFGAVAGYDEKAQQKILHAWKAGPQTIALRQQLVDLADGGTFVLSIPKAPYRCPPGPYERASQIAHYFKTHKPNSKVLVLDGNDKIISKTKLFADVWANDYKGIIEYRPNWNTTEIDAATQTVTSEIGDKERGDIINLIPPQAAGKLARDAGVINANNRWATVDWVTLESTAVSNVHVLGDATLSSPLMPKSGHMANQHGKAAAAAIVEILSGRPAQPMLMANTCYSLVDARRGIHVDSVHRYDPEKKQLLVVEGSGGVSKEPSVEEGLFARAWARNIWSDTLS